jgi:hypothetical protein
MTDATRRFWFNVDKNGPVRVLNLGQCWMWLGGTVSNGRARYGIFYVGSKQVRVHRFSWFLVYGSVPAILDHRCRNTLCVRPDHLRPATRKTNNENRVGANRNGRSGVQGAHWDKRSGKWLARVRHNGRDIQVGVFRTAEQAGEAARLKRLELFTYNDADRP